MKKTSYDYYSEHILGKSVIIHGDVWYKMKISGTRIAILNSLADVEVFEIALEGITDDCSIQNWTGIFTDNRLRKANRETKIFDNYWTMIEYAKSFFAETDS